MLKWILGIVVVVAVAIVALAPIGPLPGVWMGGTQKPAPAQWSETDLPHTIQLQTNGGPIPRVVNIWVVESGNALYVFGANDSGWVQSTKSASDVAIKAGGNAYALKASHVPDLDPQIYQKYIDRYKADYPDIIAEMPDVADMAGAGAVFRLDRP